MSESAEYRLERIETPIGLSIVITEPSGALCFHDWDEGDEAWLTAFRRRFGDGQWNEDATGLRPIFQRYFKGEVTVFDSVEVALHGTPFQIRVWTALRAIPAGTTISYATLAQRIGSPRAVRAVGLANGSNPISLVVPCHRVIGSDGSLTGYGGGLERKRWLLAHEAKYAEFRLQPTS